MTRVQRALRTFPLFVESQHFAFVEGEQTDHFESETSINHEQDEISDFGGVDHGAEIIRTFDDSESTIFACRTTS